MQNVNMYLNPGGYMLVTTFDGERVMELLANKTQHTEYYTNEKGEKKALLEIVKKYDIKDTSKPVGVGHAIDFFNGLISNEGVYNTEYLVDKRFFIKEMLEKCQLELVETDLFENQFNVHRKFFTDTYKFEENPKTRAFFEKAAEYYDQANDVNKACFLLTKLNRFYVFRKKDSANVTTSKGNKIQKGGDRPGVTNVDYIDYVMYDAPKFINPSKYVRRELESNDEFSFHRAIHDVLQTEGIIPKTIDHQAFYNDISYKLVKDKDVDEKVMKDLSKNLIIGHEDQKGMDTALDGINIIVLEADCSGIDISAVGKRKKLSTKEPTVILYNDGQFYNPVYRSKDGKQSGLFDSRMRFIREMVKGSNNSFGKYK
jgi:hypothetical protein